jgi:Fe-S-cluster containining protein
MNPAEATTRLCLECGLCCDGVLFSDVELQPGDDARQLRALGLPVAVKRGTRAVQRFPQPCAALCADNRCRIYDDRPARCREFECGVLKEVIADRLDTGAALRLIHQARQRAKRVRELLRQLGDQEEHLPLGTRFRQARRCFENGAADAAAAELFGELTLAVHQLNVLTHERFYTREGGAAAPPSATGGS